MVSSLSNYRAIQNNASPSSKSSVLDNILLIIKEKSSINNRTPLKDCYEIIKTLNKQSCESIDSEEFNKLEMLLSIVDEIEDSDHADYAYKFLLRKEIIEIMQLKDAKTILPEEDRLIVFSLFCFKKDVNSFTEKEINLLNIFSSPDKSILENHMNMVQKFFEEHPVLGKDLKFDFKTFKYFLFIGLLSHLHDKPTIAAPVLLDCLLMLVDQPTLRPVFLPELLIGSSNTEISLEMRSKGECLANLIDLLGSRAEFKNCFYFILNSAHHWDVRISKVAADRLQFFLDESLKYPSQYANYSEDDKRLHILIAKSSLDKYSPPVHPKMESIVKLTKMKTEGYPPISLEDQIPATVQMLFSVSPNFRVNAGLNLSKLLTELNTSSFERQLFFDAAFNVALEQSDSDKTACIELMEVFPLEFISSAFFKQNAKQANILQSDILRKYFCYLLQNEKGAAEFIAICSIAICSRVFSEIILISDESIEVNSYEITEFIHELTALTLTHDVVKSSPVLYEYLSKILFEWRFFIGCPLQLNLLNLIEKASRIDFLHHYLISISTPDDPEALSYPAESSNISTDLTVEETVEKCLASFPEGLRTVAFSVIQNSAYAKQHSKEFARLVKESPFSRKGSFEHVFLEYLETVTTCESLNFALLQMGQYAEIHKWNFKTRLDIFLKILNVFRDEAKLDLMKEFLEDFSKLFVKPEFLIQLCKEAKKIKGFSLKNLDCFYKFLWKEILSCIRTIQDFENFLALDLPFPQDDGDADYHKTLMKLINLGLNANVSDKAFEKSLSLLKVVKLDSNDGVPDIFFNRILDILYKLLAEMDRGTLSQKRMPALLQERNIIREYRIAKIYRSIAKEVDTVFDLALNLLIAQIEHFVPKYSAKKSSQEFINQLKKIKSQLDAYEVIIEVEEVLFPIIDDLLELLQPKKSNSKSDKTKISKPAALTLPTIQPAQSSSISKNKNVIQKELRAKKKEARDQAAIQRAATANEASSSAPPEFFLAERLKTLNYADLLNEYEHVSKEDAKVYIREIKARVLTLKEEDKLPFFAQCVKIGLRINLLGNLVRVNSLIALFDNDFLDLKSQIAINAIHLAINTSKLNKMELAKKTLELMRSSSVYVDLERDLNEAIRICTERPRSDSFSKKSQDDSSSTKRKHFAQTGRRNTLSSFEAAPSSSTETTKDKKVPVTLISDKESAREARFANPSAEQGEPSKSYRSVIKKINKMNKSGDLEIIYKGQPVKFAYLGKTTGDHEHWGYPGVPGLQSVTIPRSLHTKALGKVILDQIKESKRQALEKYPPQS